MPRPAACQGGNEWVPENECGVRARRSSRTDGLSGLEQAIRNALERAERSDPDIRARIYQSARNALDLGLRKQGIADPAVIDRQRQRLEATIRDIEDEEMARLRSIAQFERVAIEREPEDDPREAPAVELPQQPEVLREPEPVRPDVIEAEPAGIPLDAEFEDEPPAVEPVRRVDSSRDARSGGRVEPAVEIEPELRASDAARRDAPSPGDDGSLSGVSATREAQPAAPALPAEPARWDDEADVARPQRRGRLGAFLVSAFVYLFLLGIIGGGVWWVYDTGMIDAALEGSGDFQLVPEALRSDRPEEAAADTRLDTLRGFSGDWIDIYRPGADADAVRPRARAAIDQHRDSDGLATIITSNAPDQDGDVLVEVPVAFLQEMAGKTSTIAVTVKSNTDKPAQIYIQCEFKTLGDCGRHRYTVTNERADELIQVKFDGRMAPSTSGHIVINSDLTGEGSSIRLYGIRVLPGS